MLFVRVQISQCSKLSVLSLRNNNLSSLPPDIGNMRSLRVLDVIGNKYSLTCRDLYVCK